MRRQLRYEERDCRRTLINELRHGGVSPRQEVVETDLWMTVDDAGHNVGEIVVRLNAEQLAGFDQ